MNEGEWYDRQGNPVSLIEWANLFHDPDYKIVKQDQVGDYWISTVWLGLDHGLRLPGRRKEIFETLVFHRPPGKDLGDDVDCERYSTEDEALEGHEDMVERWTSD